MGPAVIGSYWEATGGPVTDRPFLSGDLEVDVAIVGAGYTGLWTAYYLSLAAPSLRIAVVEAEHVGFGASGRNGGWCSALLPMSAPTMQAAMEATVDEVGRVAAAEGIDCDFAKGGTIVFARTAVQARRAAGDDWLDAREARARCDAAGLLGATYTPHCAAIHPLRLVRGLAAAVERRGVTIYEHTPAIQIHADRVLTTHGTVRAHSVVRATEAYTSRLPGHRRTVAPVYSLMVATPVLPTSVWDTIGLRERETFSEHRHLVIYGQRTADDRLVFGGRGAPYHYGSAIRPSFDRDDRVFAMLRQTLGELFPVLGDVPIEYAWGGPLGIARDWHASVGVTKGVYHAGGYVGDGVALSNLAGRTLTALLTGATSPLLELPWVGHRSRRWEPEPLRWLGVNAGLRLMSAADAEETRTGQPSRRAALFTRLAPH
ncbi:MAG: FAD-dependent oxidoreductase [Hamadaea sp.]|nr:FAD-dependent oxidoreductase [Hamadaea sp.]NUT08378.1 FAD-dependent oxidoreductase [Hamadaea sp.]